MKRVNKLGKKSNVLNIHITELGKQKKHNEMWKLLTNFLKVPKMTIDILFPHRYVFRYSAIDQPKRQMKYFTQRYIQWKNLFLFYILILFLRFFDGGQCTRSCRIENGQNKNHISSVLSRTGNWFEPKEVWGIRIGWDKCYCLNSTSISYFSSSSSSPLNSTIIQRIHPSIETKDQWWFLTEHVCGADGKNYKNVEHALLSKQKVANCGQCAKCSTVKDVNAMHSKSEGEGNAFGLTKRASIAAVAYLFGGKLIHRFLFQNEWFVGFSKNCSECWYEATRCNLQSCARYCLFGWENPLSVNSTLNEGDGNTIQSKQLNSCMHCDEIYCSAYYLQSCGANRRTAGVVTDINRPDEHICVAARKRWKEQKKKKNVRNINFH